MDYLLDINVAILLRDAPSETMAQLEELDGFSCLSIITQIELENGLATDPDRAERRRVLLDRMMTAIRIVDFDRPCVEAYRTIIQACGFSRRKMVDRMIGATALAHDLTLVTANSRDFQDIPKLKTIRFGG